MPKYEFENFDWINKEEKNLSDLAKKSDFPQLKIDENIINDFTQLEDPTNYFDRLNPIIAIKKNEEVKVEKEIIKEKISSPSKEKNEEVKVEKEIIKEKISSLSKEKNTQEIKK